MTPKTAALTHRANVPTNSRRARLFAKSIAVLAASLGLAVAGDASAATQGQWEAVPVFAGDQYLGDAITKDGETWMSITVLDAASSHALGIEDGVLVSASGIEISDNLVSYPDLGGVEPALYDGTLLTAGASTWFSCGTGQLTELEPGDDKQAKFSCNGGMLTEITFGHEPAAFKYLGVEPAQYEGALVMAAEPSFDEPAAFKCGTGMLTELTSDSFTCSTGMLSSLLDDGTSFGCPVGQDGASEIQCNASHALSLEKVMIPLDDFAAALGAVVVESDGALELEGKAELTKCMSEKDCLR